MKKIILLSFALCLTVLAVRADVCVPTDPDYDPIDCAENGGGNVNAPGPGVIPVDGGASLLLVSGAAYGVKKLKAARAKKKAANEASAR
ncbi:MAG: hypothetical protein V4543_02275 [Bacteroidota bacterium]